MSIFLRWNLRASGLIIALMLATSLGCFRSGGASKDASAAPLPTYAEGGTLTLQMNGLPVPIQVTKAWYNNNDEGNPDSIEFEGPQTFISAQVAQKISDGPDGLSDYNPLLNKPQPVITDEASQPLTVNVPNAGAYPVTGGSITLTKFGHGMDGRDMWEGNIQLNIQSTTGPAVLPGTFKFGIEPLW